MQKKLPSAFAGTDLAAWIADNRIDTLAVERFGALLDVWRKGPAG